MTTTAYDQKFTALEDRLKKLEDILAPPGGPGLGERLSSLSDKINEAKSALRAELQDLDSRKTKEIEKVYEIVAELEKIVAALQRQVGGGRTTEA